MQGKHPLADLAPRDIVTREIIKELKLNGGDRVYLDTSSMSTEFFSNRFPTIYRQCSQQGIKLTSEFIPVRPAQHYFMGGVKTDVDGRTSIKGLFCCGECAESGIHGGNRLASNSVLECLVFGRRSARYINDNFKPCDGKKPQLMTETASTVVHTNEFFSQIEKIIKNTMTEYAGPERSFNGMLKGISILKELEEQLDVTYLSTQYHFKVNNMLQNGLAILESAYNRKESVGAHYIIDDEVK